MTAAKPSPLVPKLRFAEFRDAPGWVQTPLGDAFRTITNGHANAQDHQEDGAYPLFDRSEVTKRSPTFLFDAEAVILPGEGMRFRPRYFNGKFNLHQRAYALMEPTVDPRFAFHALDRFKGALEDSAVQSTVRSLRMPIIEKFAIPCPTSCDEQQKIADCLGSLDDLIATEGRKLEALRQHKQGLMQQLFPQPGETVPRLRFPEFQDGPEWDLSTLSSASDVNPSNDGLPEFFIYIDLESVKSGRLVERKEITRDTAPSRAQRLLGRKDIIYQTVRPYQRNNFFFNINDGREYVASTGYAQLRAHESPEFLYQLLHTDSFVSSVLARCTGSNYPAINPSALASIDVVLPQKTEQQKIADCLGSLDDLIEAGSRKLEALQQHKLGLMQQLFPSLERQ